MPRQLLIRSNGTVGKCTVMFQDERNSLGELNEDGTVTLNNEKFKLWTRGFDTLEFESLRCPAKSLPKLETKKTEKELENMIEAVNVG